MTGRLTLLLLIVLGVGVAVAQKTKQKTARLSNYCSFPPCCRDKKIQYTAAEKKYCPDTQECIKYSGCKYQGDFSFCGENKSHNYVKNKNIVSFFSTHGDISKYINKTIKITQGDKSIVATVCDTCSDKDCKGCCTKNAGKSGYLVDMEANTFARFGGTDGKEVTFSLV